MKDCKQWFKFGYEMQMGLIICAWDGILPAQTKSYKDAYADGVLLAIQHKEEYMREFKKQSEE